jgi:hypothetical protein
MAAATTLTLETGAIQADYACFLLLRRLFRLARFSLPLRLSPLLLLPTPDSRLPTKFTAASV